MHDRPNVVLLVLDTTRARDVDPRTAPELSRLADRGTRCTRAFAAAPWTLPSHASLFTGLSPSNHGTHAGHERLRDGPPTMAECFRAAGYETAGISNNTWISVESGFGRGFDTFRQAWQYLQSSAALGELVEVTDRSRLRAVAEALVDGNPAVNAANALYRLLVRDRTGGDKGAARTTEWIRGWLAERDGTAPFFLFANYLEPHLEYRPPERLAARFLPGGVSYAEATNVPQAPWAYLAGDVSLSEREFEILAGLYRAEIAYLDEQVEAVRAALVEAGEWENSVVVVTGDHGENVGEHGLMDHQYCLYDTLLHVPLVLHGGAFAGGGDLDRLVSLTDLFPTLLDAAGIDGPTAGIQGRSFHPDAGAAPRDHVFAEYVTPQPSMAALDEHVGDLPDSVYRYDRSLRAVRSERYKLVRGSDGSRRLYRVGDDADETRDVADARPERAADLEATLDRWLESFEQSDAGESVPMSGERRTQLERLGYLQ